MTIDYFSCGIDIFQLRDSLLRQGNHLLNLRPVLPGGTMRPFVSPTTFTVSSECSILLVLSATVPFVSKWTQSIM